MGLDVSHDCWHGAYSAFHRWRVKLCEVAGLPPLDLMEGFYEAGGFNPLGEAESGAVRGHILAQLPISWDCLKPSPLHTLLNHSDCDGSIAWGDCAAMADALEALMPELPADDDAGHIGNWREKTQAFIDGLRLAAEQKEDVEFH